MLRGMIIAQGCESAIKAERILNEAGDSVIILADVLEPSHERKLGIFTSGLMPIEYASKYACATRFRRIPF
jgi:hypothetical protein